LQECEAITVHTCRSKRTPINQQILDRMKKILFSWRCSKNGAELSTQNASEVLLIACYLLGMLGLS